MKVSQFFLAAFVALFSTLNLAQSSYSAQDPSDSLCRHYNKLAQAFTNEQPDSALFFARKMMAIGTKWNNQKGIAVGLNRVGILLRDQGKYDRALEALDSSLSIFTEIRDSIWVAHTILITGSVYDKMGDYEKQIEYLLQSLQRFENLDDPQSIRASAHAKNHIGSAFYEMGERQHALEYFEAAYAQFVSINDSSSFLGPVNNIGMIYDDMDSLDLALKYYWKAYDLNEKITQSASHRGQILTNIGDLLRSQGKYADALKNHKQALEIALELHQPTDQMQALIGLGRDRLSLGEYDLAMGHVNSSLAISRKIGAKEHTLKALKLRTEVLKLQKRFEELAYAYEAVAQLGDSIINEEKAKAIAELEIKFKTEQKEKEILLKEQALLRSETEREAARVNMVLLALGLALVILASVAIIVNYRSRSRANQLKVSLVEAELEASKLREEKAELELEENRKSLTSYSLLLAQRNEILTEIKSKLESALKTNESVESEVIRPLISSINAGIAFDNEWEEFRLRFEKVHTGFFKKLDEKHPELTSNECRLLALISLNLARKQIASLLNISSKGVEVAQYRIRKKLSLDASQDLAAFASSL